MKKIILMLSFTLFALSSCSSEDNSGNSNNNGVILLKRVESSNDEIAYLEYNGTKLNYISNWDEYGEFSRTQFTYSGDLITKTEVYVNNQPTGEKTTCTYSNNKLIEERNYFEGAILESIKNYTYNSDGTVDILTTYYDVPSVEFVKVFYDSNNNTIKKEYMDGYVELFEYDDKNNPFKNITGFIFPSFFSGNNNVISENYPNSLKTFNYLYNSQNYPNSREILQTGQAPVIQNYYYE